MSQISYSDGMLLKYLCENMKRYVKCSKDFNLISKNLKKYISKVEKKSNGYWSLPTGKTVFLDALKALSLMCQYGVTEYEIDALYHDYSIILSTIRNKCNVTFFVQEYSIWSSLKGVYSFMMNDFRYEVKVVYVPFRHLNATYEDNNIELYRKDGVQVTNYEKYNLSEDNPDIVFFAKPYDCIPSQFYITEVEKIIDKTVYIPYGMESTFRLLRYGFQEYLHYRVWRHIVYGEYVKEVGKKFGYRNGENIVVWGHPKMDCFANCNNVDVPQEWKEKIDIRKVVCWCPHHTILHGKEHLSTWLDYQETIFEWFEKHTDMVLLWRPHPLLFGAIVNNGFMSQNELEAFVNEKKNKENIIFDDYENYYFSFECSDAMLTDGTTFSVEYLGTGKPLMLTTDDITSYYNYEEAEKGLYIGSSKESVIEFLENVRNDCDPKRESRNAYTQKTIFYPKGKTISEYIADNILEDLLHAQENLARSICE